MTPVRRDAERRPHHVLENDFPFAIETQPKLLAHHLALAASSSRARLRQRCLLARLRLAAIAKLAAMTQYC
jgi:hypothetical protein